MDEKNFSTQQSKKSEDVIDFYDKYAKSWDERFGNKKSVAKFHEIRKNTFFKLANLNRSKTAIELGVGTGPYLEDIAPKVKKLICVDGSKEMLLELEKKTSKYKNVELFQIDLAKPLQNKEVKGDVVYFFGLIEHIINVDIFIDNCKKMLIDGGSVIIITPNALSPWYYGIRRLLRSGAHLSTDKYYSKNKLIKIFSNHGFTYGSHIYWGFFPAGIGDLFFKLLYFMGKILEKTPFRVFAGGLTIKFISN